MADFASLVLKADSSDFKDVNTTLQKTINISTGVDRAATQLEQSFNSAASSANFFNSMIKDGENITKSLRTPLEKYNDNLTELNRLLHLDAISQETYNRALKQADIEYKDLSGETQRAKIAQDMYNKQLQEGKLLTQSLRNPQERYKDTVANINKLLQSGAISQETYNRALRQVNIDYKNSTNKMNEFFGSMMSLKFGIISVIALLSTGMVKSLYDVNNQIDAMNMKMNAAIPGIGNGAKEMQWITQEADRMGVELRSTSNAYSDFAAASLRSGMSLKDTRKIFTDIAESAVSMQLSNEKISSVMNALTQISSKGVVSMEELRQQLGDSLPGAVNIAARSMGMTSQAFMKAVSDGKVLSNDFLPKFAAQIKQDLGGSFEYASKNIKSNVNRMSNEFLILKGNFTKLFTDNANSGVVGLSDSLKDLNENFGYVAATVQILLVPVTILWNAFDILATSVTGAAMILFNIGKMVIIPLTDILNALVNTIFAAGNMLSELIKGNFSNVADMGKQYVDMLKNTGSDIKNVFSQSWEDIKLLNNAIGNDIDKQITDIATQIGKAVLAVESAGDQIKKAKTDLNNDTSGSNKKVTLISEEELKRQIELLQEGINVTKEFLSPLQKLQVEEQKLDKLYKEKAISFNTYKLAREKANKEYTDLLKNEIETLSSGLLTEEENIKQSYSNRHDLIIESSLLTDKQKTDLLDRLEEKYNQDRFDSLYNGLLTEEQQINLSYERRKKSIIESAISTDQEKNSLLFLLEEQHTKNINDLYQQQYDSLSSGLLTEEELIKQSYERRNKAIIDSYTLTEEQKNDLLLRNELYRNQQTKKLESERLASIGQSFESLANMAKKSNDEQLGLYKALFIASKGFAIADSMIQIANAIAKAMNSPWPTNLLVAVPSVLAASAGIIGSIKDISYAGAFDNGGYIPAGKWGYVGEYGPEKVQGPATVTSRVDTAKELNENSGNHFHVHISDYSGREVEYHREKVLSKEYDNLIYDWNARAREIGA